MWFRIFSFLNVFLNNILEYIFSFHVSGRFCFVLFFNSKMINAYLYSFVYFQYKSLFFSITLFNSLAVSGLCVCFLQAVLSSSFLLCFKQSLRFFHLPGFVLLFLIRSSFMCWFYFSCSTLFLSSAYSVFICFC